MHYSSPGHIPTAAGDLSVRLFPCATADFRYERFTRLTYPSAFSRSPTVRNPESAVANPAKASQIWGRGLREIQPTGSYQHALSRTEESGRKENLPPCTPYKRKQGDKDRETPRPRRAAVRCLSPVRPAIIVGRRENHRRARSQTSVGVRRFIGIPAMKRRLRMRFIGD